MKIKEPTYKELEDKSQQLDRQLSEQAWLIEQSLHSLGEEVPRLPSNNLC